MKKDTAEKLAAVILVGALYLGMFALGITCPIKFATGISCAGCGMTRAWLSVLRLDFESAFYYHPLYWILPPAGVLYLAGNRLNRKFRMACFYAICAAFVIVYLYRLIWGTGDIVVFEPAENIMFRGIRILIGGN